MFDRFGKWWYTTEPSTSNKSEGDFCKTSFIGNLIYNLNEKLGMIYNLMGSGVITIQTFEWFAQIYIIKTQKDRTIG